MSSLGNSAARGSSSLGNLACTEWSLRSCATESSLGNLARTEWLLRSSAMDSALEKHDSAESESPLHVVSTDASLMVLGTWEISVLTNHSCNRICTI